MIIHGDCLEKMKEMADCSIDFICTDPPYGLKFMGKQWDHGIPGVEFWAEMLRICKPGSMLAAFGGTRTFHRLTCAIEDAGWRIMDCACFLYGSGFPKAMNYGKKLGGKFEGYSSCGLKPAWEPIIIAQKNLEGSYIENAEKWGLGGVNIDASRIPTDDNRQRPFGHPGIAFSGALGEKGMITGDNSKGRWPANLILDEQAAEMLDQMSGVSKSSSGIKKPNNPTKDIYGKYIPEPNKISGYNDCAGASRFFYCAKASTSERQGSKHPTIKPKALLKYLIKLLASPNNPICLDPFMGSGTCGIVCKELGIRFIGIEKESEYYEDAKRRIDLADATQCDLFDESV